jgi:hypothetical protein
MDKPIDTNKLLPMRTELLQQLGDNATALEVLANKPHINTTDLESLQASAKINRDLIAKAESNKKEFLPDMLQRIKESIIIFRGLSKLFEKQSQLAKNLKNIAEDNQDLVAEVERQAKKDN